MSSASLSGDQVFGSDSANPPSGSGSSGALPNADTVETAPTEPALHGLLRTTQRRLENLYGLEPAPDVTLFTFLDPENRPERVLVRETLDALELQLSLPANLDVDAAPQSDDHVSVVEGVSHFVHLAERSRTRLSTSHLELELQAEVDKFVLLWDHAGSSHPSLLTDLHDWLFARVTYLDEPGTVPGDRYRLANRLAARLCGKLVERARRASECVAPLPFLRHFYRCGLSDKIHLAQAA